MIETQHQLDDLARSINKPAIRCGLKLSLIAAIFVFSVKAFAPESKLFSASDEVEIPLTRYPAVKMPANKQVLLWLPSEVGLLSQERQAAKAHASISPSPRSAMPRHCSEAP